jgi:metalloendopeptidase OMA1, mitochondrial
MSAAAFSRRHAAALGAACLLALATGCGFGPAEEGEGPGRRHQPLALSPEEELRVGRQAYKEVMRQHRGRVLTDDEPRVVRCRHIVGKLAKAAEIEPLQREINLRVRDYIFDWQVNVIRDRQVNAFCVPAGLMGVYTGILDVAGPSDAALAAVLSHEMAHALAHHASERVAREQSAGGNILAVLSYGRMQESEADHIGIFLMAFAGYDPDEASRFWLRMSQARGGGGGTPEIFSSHPSDRRRFRDLARWAPRARAAKKAYDEGRIAPPGRK